MSKTIQVRRLIADEVQKLGLLFAEEKTVGQKIDFWQDRRADFLKIYEHHSSGEPFFWGAFADQKLIGTSGLIETPVNIPFAGIKAYLDTDFFVSPQSRGSSAAVKILRRRNEDYIKDHDRVGSPLIFGVEHIPNNLQVGCRISEPYGSHVNFVFQSLLTEVFLTQLPPVGPSEVQITKLNAMSSQLLEQWVSLYTESRRPYFLSPQISRQTFQKMQSIDPDAECFMISEGNVLKAASLLFDTRAARHLILTNRPNLVRARIERDRKCSLAEGAEWLIAMASLSVQSGSARLRPIFQSMVHRAYQKGLHAVAFRDELETDLSGLTQDKAEYPRRVFITFGPQFQFKDEFFHGVRSQSYKTRLDAAFV